VDRAVRLLDRAAQQQRFDAVAAVAVDLAVPELRPASTTVVTEMPLAISPAL
jgi:hypothetical protein